MEADKTDLKTIFDFVQGNQWSSARQIGKGLAGGKSRANHYLYGYLDILFTKKGLTPPQWQVISDDAYSKMLGRVIPSPVPMSTLAVVPAIASIAGVTSPTSGIHFASGLLLGLAS